MTINFQLDYGVFSDYIDRIKPADEMLTRILDYNACHPQGKMMVDPLQMRALCWLANLINTRHYLELGVFTGYSSTAMALSLPKDAELYLCDVSVTYTNIARGFWQAAGIVDRIKLYLQPALISLAKWAKEPHKREFFDFVLIDADKAFIAEYVEYIYPLLRVGGVIAVDNTYQRGRVADATSESDSISLKAMRQFNQAIMQDSDGRFATVMLPLGDGLTLLLKN